MRVFELFSRASVANIVAGAIMLLATGYAIATRDTELLRTLTLIASGYLFGVAMPRAGQSKG